MGIVGSLRFLSWQRKLSPIYRNKMPCGAPGSPAAETTIKVDGDARATGCHGALCQSRPGGYRVQCAAQARGPAPRRRSNAMNVMPTSVHALSRRSALIIAAYGLSIMFTGLGARQLTRHEVLAAYPAKEMLRYGHWIVPMYAGIPRLLKPPTTGWLIAGAMAATGSDAAWVARLPSALASVALALVVALLAARYFGDRVGLAAGLIQLTCYYVLNWGRLAEADIFLCLSVTASLACFALGTIPVPQTPAGNPAAAEVETPAPSRLLRIGFFAFAGLSFLVKGPIGLLFIALTVAAFLLATRRRAAARCLYSPAGWLVFLVCVLGWPVAAWVSHPPILEAWQREMGGTAGGGFGTDPLYKYLYAVPFVLLPWTPLMAAGAYLAWKRGLFVRPVGRLFLCWFAPGMIALHFIAMKSHHYPMPLLPPLSVVGAIALAEALAPMRRPVAAAACLFGGIWIAVVALQLLAMPRFDEWRPQADFARRAAAHVPAEEKIYIIDHPDRRTGLDDPRPRPEPYVAYHLRPPIWRFRNEREFAAFAAPRIAGGQTLYAVATEAQRQALASLGDMSVLDRCAGLRRGEKEPHRLLLLKMHKHE